MNTATMEEILDYPEWQQRAYENLANAIVEGMAKDYIDHLLFNGLRSDTSKKLYIGGSDAKGLHLKRTLNGDWYHTLTKIDSSYMISKCESEAYSRWEKAQENYIVHLLLNGNKVYGEKKIKLKEKDLKGNSYRLIIRSTSHIDKCEREAYSRLEKNPNIVKELKQMKKQNKEDSNVEYIIPGPSELSENQNS